jgi:hypothetical protein
MEVCSCNHSCTGGIGRRIRVWSGSGQKLQDPIWKITKARRVGVVVSVVECLPSMYKVVSSNTSTTKNNNNKITKCVQIFFLNNLVFKLAYIKSTRGVHFDYSVCVYTILWTNSPSLLYFHIWEYIYICTHTHTHIYISKHDKYTLNLFRNSYLCQKCRDGPSPLPPALWSASMVQRWL